MPQRSIDIQKTVRDRLLLLAVALLVFTGGIGFVAVLRGWLSLSSEWTLFILGSFLYVFTTVYLASKSSFFRVRTRRMQRYMCLAGVMAATICFTFVVLLAGVVPTSNRVITCFVYTMVLAPLTIVLTERLFRKAGNNE
jgi:hypothetical protein